MKKLSVLLIVYMFSLTPLFLHAQTPPHPNGGNAPGGGNSPVGGAEPIDGGLSLMILLGAAYKAFQLKRNNK